MPRTKLGFTLIELLVVVTIIVVLLAMLTPALDRALYSAELTVCGARLDAVAASTQVYAMGNRRFYPYRIGVATPDVNWQPEVLTNGERVHDAAAGRGGLTRYDDRPLLDSYLPINTYLNDPFTDAVDFTRADDDSSVWASYYLWFGWQYRGANGGRPMAKVGDGFFWRDTVTDPANPRTAKYTILASDRNYMNTGYGSQCSHPDSDGKMFSVALENQTFNWQGLSLKFTISTWRMETGDRGPVDLNFAYSDGSVARIDKIEYFDERMSVLGYDENGSASYPGSYIGMPKP